jgi:hypothetical protein
MTQDEIIALAVQAGVFEITNGYEIFYRNKFEAFVKLVDAKASAREREACAKVCEKHGYDHYCGNVTDKIAETIRARGQA